MKMCSFLDSPKPLEAIDEKRETTHLSKTVSYAFVIYKTKSLLVIIFLTSSLNEYFSSSPFFGKPLESYFQKIIFVL